MATAYTSNSAGDWHTTTIWTPNGLPSAASGDTVTINHAVTVNQNESIGSSPNDVTTAVVTIGAAGTLAIGTGATLTVKGNIAMSNGAHGSLAAGGILSFDNSASGGTPVYRISGGGIYYFAATGTSGNNCGITSATSTGWQFHDGGNDYMAWWSFVASYCTFRRMRPGSRTGWWPFDGGTVSITNCIFDGCGTVWARNSTKTDITVIFEDNMWRNGSYPSTGACELYLQAANLTGTRRFRRNVLDGGLNYLSVGFSVVGNVIQDFGVGGTLSSATSMTEFRGNFTVCNNAANSGNGCVIPGPMYRNYWVNDRAIGNPHFVAGTAFGSDTALEQNIFENQANDLVDTGDCIILYTGCSSGGASALIRNNIAIRAKDGEMSGQLLTIYSNDVITTQCTRNTVNVDDTAIFGIGKRAAFAVSEASDGAANQVPILKGNLAYGSSGSQGYLAERVRPTGLQDVITASGADYNWCYNTSAGDNLRSYNDKDGSGNMWSTGNAVGAGVDVHQGSGDPAFYAGTRNMAAWATARGYGSTYAAALAALVTAPSRIENLIAFIFEGYRPTAAGTRNASPDGMCVGAANWCNTARVSSHVSAWEATLTTFGITAS